MIKDSRIGKHQMCTELVKACKRMSDLGLVRSSSGNISVRYEDGMLISASNIPYDCLTASQIIEVDQNGNNRSGDGAPSSEWRMHAAIYEARDDVEAIVHTHSPYATAVSIARRCLPMVHDEGRILFGDEIPVAVHELPGTLELARAAAEALGHGRAVLLAEHGVVVVEQDIANALLLAEKLEEMAKLFWLSQLLIK